jgi:hypothetical protein
MEEKRERDAEALSGHYSIEIGRFSTDNNRTKAYFIGLKLPAARSGTHVVTT